MSLEIKINEDIKQAMLQKKKEELLPLRSIKSAILLAKSEKGPSTELTEDQELKMLMKLAKQRKDSAELYAKENRNDLAEKELFELDIIQNYLPKMMTEEEIENAVKTIIEKTGAESMKDMGKVMGIASKELTGKAEGKMISEIVKKLLS